MDQKLLNRIKYILSNCRYLMLSTFGREFEASGNIGIFSQSEDEYEKFKYSIKKLIKHSDNPNQKYFELKDPLTLRDGNYVTKITHIYIRRFDISDYGKNKGDIDFILDDQKYQRLKAKVQNSEYPGAEMYNRPGWDTIQIMKKGTDVVSYLSTVEMAEKVRLKFDNVTNL